MTPEPKLKGKTDEERWVLGSSLHPDEQRYVLELFPESRRTLGMTDAQWLGQIEFLVKKDGSLDLRKRYCRLPAVPGEPDRRFHRAPRYEPLPAPPQRQPRTEWNVEAIEAALLTRTPEGRGDYTETVSYKFAHGDLTREEAAQAMGAPLAVVPIFWGAEDHERLASQQSTRPQQIQPPPADPEQREQQQPQPEPPPPQLPPAEPRPSRAAEGQTYTQRVWTAYQALVAETKFVDVPIHALHRRVGGSLLELQNHLRAECLAHRAVPSTGEPALAGDAARQSALTPPGETDRATGKPQSFLLIKLTEPRPMTQEPQPPQPTAAPTPSLGRRLTRDDLDVILEALEYRCEAIEGGTDFDEVARLKSIVPTLEKLRALEAQPQRAEHERYESLLRATAALRNPESERTLELQARIEKTIARKVGEFTQERQVKAYEASLRKTVAERHPDLTPDQAKHYERRIGELVTELRQKQAQQQQAQTPACCPEQARGRELER